MKSIYNKIVRSERAQLQNLNDLSDVSLGDPLSDKQVLKRVDNQWTNEELLLKADLADVGTIAVNQTLKLESDQVFHGSDFVSDIQSSGVGSSLINTTSGSTTFLKSVSNGANINFNETSNNISIEATVPVQSVFSRTGAVVAQNNDYSISQIQNSSTLANSANVDINAPSNKQFLEYNSSSNKWQNADNYNYKYIVNQDNQTMTAAFDTIYTGSSNSYTMPNPGLSDVGKKIKFVCANTSNTTISFPTGVFLQSATNFFTISNLGSITFVVASATQWQIDSGYGPWAEIGGSGKAFFKRALTDLDDTNIVTPLNGQMLQYDGTNWKNAPALWDDLRVSMDSTTRQGSRDPTYSKILDNGAGSQGVFLWHFHPNNEEELYFSCQFPHSYKEGTNIFPHIHFMPTTNNAGTVRWGLEYTWMNPNSVFPNTEIIYGERAFNANSRKMHLIQEFNIFSTGPSSAGLDGTGYAISSMLICRVFRNSTHINDNYPDAAAALEVDFHYQKDGNGSNTATAK